jgi:hypothetical protein
MSADTLRRWLLGLAALTSLGLIVELAAERHWTQPSQWIAWTAIAATLLAAALLYWRASPVGVRTARLLAMAVILSAMVGIWQHVASNYDAGPLDAKYELSWDTLSEPTRWWLALSKTVGPSPPLAPGILALAGQFILLASTQRRAPTSRGRPVESPADRSRIVLAGRRSPTVDDAE